MAVKIFQKGYSVEKQFRGLQKKTLNKIEHLCKLGSFIPECWSLNNILLT